MEDIEDMFKDPSDQIESRLPATKRKILRNKQLKKNGEAKEDGAKVDEKKDTVEDPTASAAPGTQSVFVKTYGCSHNISDSEYMAGLLADYGFKIVDDMEQADACLLNSCTVKNPS